MIDHLKLLGVMVNLAIGAGIVFYAWHKAKTSAAPFLKFLVLQIALMNLAFWLLFLSRYFALNVPGQWRLAVGSGLTDAGLILSYAILGGMAYAIMRIVWGILGRPAPRLLMKWITAGTAILVLGYGIKWLVAKNSFWWKAHYQVYENLGIVYFLLEIYFLIHLWRMASREGDAVKARLGKSFALLYLVRYPALGLAILIPRPFRAFVVMLFLNAVPVIWIRLFIGPYQERLERTAVRRSEMGEAELEAICREHDISKRERDILALILAGKSNRDIERELFISYHTVKNHIYNMFQKLGVKNRFELARLIENRARDRRAVGPGAGTERS